MSNKSDLANFLASAEAQEALFKQRSHDFEEALPELEKD